MVKKKLEETKPKHFEYIEIDLGVIIGEYMRNLPDPESWEVPAIDTVSKCVIFRREIKEAEVKKP